MKLKIISPVARILVNTWRKLNFLVTVFPVVAFEYWTKSIWIREEINRLSYKNLLILLNVYIYTILILEDIP